MATTLPDMRDFVALMQSGRYSELEGQARKELRRHPRQGLVWKALSVALRLQGKDALDALKKATELLPDDAEAAANLGHALLDGRRFEDAVACYRRVLALRPGDADAYNNLGTALRGLGQCDEALECYRQAILRDPHSSVAHNNLGNALRGLGRLEQAVASYNRAIEIDPNSAEASNNLGNALFDLGRIEDALRNYQRAVAIKPQFAEAHSNLGNALRNVGRYDDAAASYRRALVLKPDFAGAHSNLSDALRDLGRLEEAAASSRRAIEIDPGLAGAHNSLGNVLVDLGQLDEAAASYRHALALDRGFVEAHINHAMVLRLQGRAEEAEASCRAALSLNERAAAAIVLLAELQTDCGRFDAAEDLLKSAVTIDPDLLEAWAGMAHLRKMTENDQPWLAQAQRIAASRLPPRQEVYLRYAIGKYFDDVRDFDQAFESYRRANQLAKLYSSGHDAPQLTRAVDQLISTFDQRWVDRVRSRGTGRESPDAMRPVFIIGMPRSGTTLAEQILASHPAVYGAGELIFWNTAYAALRSIIGDATARSKALSVLGQDYLRLLATLSVDAERVVDKMPANFLALGLIHEVLPHARIIHMQRNPLDTCLSIYFQHFKTGHSYTHDLDDLAHYYREYSRLMAHWRTLFSDDVMLEVPYEGLVDAQETWSRRMLAFIDLAWDPQCLDFYRTDRNVITASKWQVRQKITRASVGRHRHYEKFLGSLRSLG